MVSRFLLAFFLCLPCWGLPEDFVIEEFVDGLKDPATMTFSPDGRLFVGERIAGRVRVVTSSGQLLAEPFLTLEVPPARHRSGGLRGMVFDPGFPAEPYFYVFYTKQFSEGVRHNRVSRFEVSSGDSNRVDPASEIVLLELPFNDSDLGSSGSHNGGALVFGGDGKLYITTGDGWRASAGYGPGDTVQSLSTYTGKLFRMNRDGSIPDDNPFFNTATGSYRAIYALGFRNPYAATVHPVSGEVFVFDVGEVHGRGKDYVYRISAGANYQHDGSGSGIGTNATPWVHIGKPIVSGGAWYFGDQFPESYRGRLFVTSWHQGLRMVRSLTDATVEEFASEEVSNQGPVQPQVGPDGLLYFLDTDYETNDGKVYRISYLGNDRAQTPVIFPNGGTFVDRVIVQITNETAGAEIRYTLDGSDPTVNSPLWNGSLELTASTELRTRAFLTGLDPSPVSSALFVIETGMAPVFTDTAPLGVALGAVYRHQVQATGTPMPWYSLDAGPVGMTVHPETGKVFWRADQVGEVAFTVRASNGIEPDAVREVVLSVNNLKTPDEAGSSTQSGLRFSHYDRQGEVERTGVASVPNAAVVSGTGRLEFYGYLEVPETGLYALSSEAEVFIGGVRVSGEMGLEVGTHLIRIKYDKSIVSDSFTIRWSGPGFSDQPIPASAFSHQETSVGLADRRPLPPYMGVFPQEESGILPATLSETGAFANVAGLVPVDGLVPYAPNAKLWSDGADKRRWLALPHGTLIEVTSSGAWAYPSGTVLIKHFEIGIEKRRIETRFEVVKEDGSSYLVTYRWREDQMEADLVPSEGAETMLAFDDRTQSWAFPSRADCLACHNSSVSHVLGLGTRQLNGLLTYTSGMTDNQLLTWSSLGLLDQVLDPSAHEALASLDDAEASLEHRARSYLEANCAFCHHTNAAPEGTNFVLESNIPLNESGLVNAFTSKPLGLGSAARVIAERDPRNSVLFHRLAGNDPETRMPPIGRAVVDERAREVMARWILSLPPSHTATDVPGYRHRWTFDGTASPGTWRDQAQAASYEAGREAEALRFDGVDDAVDLGPIDVPSGAGLTITLWFKADDFGIPDARFLSKADGDQDQDHYWMLSTLDETKMRLRLRAGGSTTTLISEAGTLAPGVWTHVAARYDGSTMSLYKDGALVASTPKTGVLDTNGTVDAAIGNQPLTATGGSRPFDGLIDDVRIYARALDPVEIRTLYEGDGTPNAAPTVALQIPSGAVGPKNFLTRADVTQLSVVATDVEDGDLGVGVTWFSTRAGDVTLDTLPDGPHSLVATVRDSGGSANSALFETVIVPGFTGWATDRGLSPSPLSDPDGNGRTMLEEYALLGTPQWLADPPRRLLIPFNPLAIDVLLGAELSEDLRGWDLQSTWTPTGDGEEQEVLAPVSDPDRQFGRVSVELR